MNGYNFENLKDVSKIIEHENIPNIVSIDEQNKSNFYPLVMLYLKSSKPEIFTISNIMKIM